MAHQLNHVIKSNNGAKSNILFIFFSLYTSFLALFESISILSKLIYLKTTFRKNSILQILDKKRTYITISLDESSPMVLIFFL
jgi:hypothetical protein